MIYRVFNPTPALSDIVEQYWYSKVELTGSDIQYYPTPLLQGLTFNFQKQEESHQCNNKTLNLYRQAYFFGQPTCPRTITRKERGMHMLGVKFKPLGIAKLTGLNMEHTVDSVVAAEDLWGNEFEWLWDEIQSASSIEHSIVILERFLFKKYTKTFLNHRVDDVHRALSVIDISNGSMTIKELGNQTNTTTKTLERAFQHYLGLKPKFYSQIVRFNSAKRIMDTQNILDISDLGFQLGYYDGSHFSAEFKRFAGRTPSEHIARKHAKDHFVSFCPFFPKRNPIFPSAQSLLR